MTTLPIIGKSLPNLDPLVISETETDKRIRRRRYVARFIVISVFVVVLGVFFYLSKTRDEKIYGDLLLSYWAFLIGVAVGAGELMGRYRDAPFASLVSKYSFVYLTFNGVAAVAAFFVINMFGWTFGLTPKNATNSDTIQVLVAGFGAMALFRSSLFTAHVGDQEVGVGPHIILQTVLNAADSEVNRESAVVRARRVEEIMESVDADKARYKLPRLCSRVLPNSLSESDEKIMKEKIKEIFEEDSTALSPNGEGQTKPTEHSKAYLLGLTLMNYVGKDVLNAAVQTLGSEIQTENTKGTSENP